MAGIPWMMIVAYLAGLLLLYLAGWLLLVPLKKVLKLVLHALLGAVSLLLVNWIGGWAGVEIALNPITALIAGLLGLPGVILLLLVRIIVAV